MLHVYWLYRRIRKKKLSFYLFFKKQKKTRYFSIYLKTTIISLSENARIQFPVVCFFLNPLYYFIYTYVSSVEKVLRPYEKDPVSQPNTPENGLFSIYTICLVNGLWWGLRRFVFISIDLIYTSSSSHSSQIFRWN